MSTGETNSGGLIERPSYLKDHKPDVEMKNLMAQYMQPPRLKLIQGSTKSPFKPPFSEGDAIIIPQLTKVGDAKTEFTFVPVAFFHSWIMTNPYQMKGTLPYIRERSYDPNSEVAKKANAFIKIRCPENQEYFCKYLKVMNFLVRIDGDYNLPLSTPVAFTFLSSAYKVGQALLGLIQNRKDADMYLCRFAASTKFVPDPKGEYHELTIRNAPNAWLEEDKVELYKSEYDNLKEMIRNNSVDIDMDDSDVSGNGGDAANDSKF